MDEWGDICQKIKYENVHYPGLLQPLPIPKTLWKDIGIEFIDGLPISNHKNSILVAVDRLTKHGHFITLKHPYTTQAIAEVFLKEIYRLHRLPKSIVVDGDSIFTSLFWKQLFTTLKTKINTSSLPSTIRWSNWTSQQICRDLPQGHSVWPT